MIGIIIVNRNNYDFTNQLLQDLSKQNNLDFELTIYDNNSKNNLNKIKSWEKYTFIKDIIFNETNVPLCHLWNKFYLDTDYDLLAFLNNDIRIPNNFISDTKNIFIENSEIGIVVHATNNPKYQIKTELNYITFKGKYMQGWDFTIRRDAYTLIPKQLHFFCGDDFIYTHLYEKKWKLAYALSSPIIHFCGKTIRVKGVSDSDIKEYKALGYKHGKLKVCKKISHIKPNLEKLKKHIALK